MEAGKKVKSTKANTLDLVIVMDCTYSMEPWIEAAKTSIIAIIQNVNVDHPNAKVRVGFVAYRDFCDGDKRLQVQPLTEEVDTVRDFISSLRAFGGGDGPEDIPGGLQKAIELDFQAEGKLIVLVADAPCHGSKFHDTRDDPIYKREILASPDICAQMRLIARKGIDFTFIEVKPKDTAKMVAILESEYQSVKSADESERDFVKVSLDKSGDVVRFASVVCSSASSSLTASKSRSVLAKSRLTLSVSSCETNRPTIKTASPPSAGREIADEVVETRSATLHSEESEFVNETTETRKAPPLSTTEACGPETMLPAWGELTSAPEVVAVRHSLQFQSNESIDWTDFTLKHTTEQTMIRVLPTCFARGANRSAHALYDCKDRRYCVAKFALPNASRPRVENNVEMQTVAQQLVTEFPIVLPPEAAVELLSTCWYEIADPTAIGLDAAMTSFTVEPFVRGGYKTYDGNRSIGAEGHSLSDTAQAFSHFMWQKTLGQLLIVGFKVVESVFADPQIHSQHGDRFGPSNLSMTAITAFFNSHECNEVCRMLELTPFEEVGGKVEIEAATVVEKTEKPEARETGTDQFMMCCCLGCGAIMGFNSHEQGRSTYCESCTASVSRSESLRRCSVCQAEVLFLPYCDYKNGTEIPVMCDTCNADAVEYQHLDKEKSEADIAMSWMSLSESSESWD
ncbi:hypothetical protein BBJ28_00009854 [Nothophytophthora sp. Chile5]|nr:hypothetical protein BBJ28_00009854 [Nothophytophthora sp. Chile5]